MCVGENSEQYRGLAWASGEMAHGKEEATLSNTAALLSQFCGLPNCPHEVLRIGCQLCWRECRCCFTIRNVDATVSVSRAICKGERANYHSFSVHIHINQRQKWEAISAKFVVSMAENYAAVSMPSII